MNTSVLLALGCTEKETLLYVTLIDKGFSNVSTLCRTTKEHRPTCYALLSSLIKKGFVKKVKRLHRYYYEACDPSIIETKFKELNTEADLSLRALKSMYTVSGHAPIVTTYTKSAGINAIFEDIAKTLPKNGTYFRYSSRTKDTTKTLLYSKAVKEKEFERLVITSEVKAGEKSKDPNRFIKTVPKGLLFDDNISVLIYGNKVAHIDHTSDTGIIIESSPMAKFQEKLFKLLWKKL